MKIVKNLAVSLIMAMFVITQTAPVGLCVTNAQLPQLPAINSQPKTFNLNGSSQLSKRNPKITLSLRDSDVKQVLRMFADKAGMNIIFHSSLDNTDNEGEETAQAKNRNVTMDLVKVPLNEAFAMVLQVADLTYYTEGNTIVVLTSEAAKKSNIGKQNMMVLPVRYVDASKIATFLNKNIYAAGKPGLSNSEIAVTNPETNEILLFGNQNDYAIAKKIITEFDKKPLEETFVVNHTTPKEMSGLICSILFKDLMKSEKDEGIVSKVTLEEEKDDNDDDDDDENETEKVEEVSVGKGILACQFRSPVKAGSLVSMDTGGLSIVYFPDRGTILARGGTAVQMQEIKDFIARNDKKQLQAYLEVSILELNETGSKQFANTWNVWSDFFTGSFNGTSSSTSTPIFFSGDSVPGASTIAKYSGLPVITYSISYLIENGNGRVLANPKILITSGQKSIIDLSSDYVKKVTSQVMDTVSSMTGSVQRTYDIGNDEGIKVELQPYISPDGYVTMNIIPEYATPKEYIYDSRVLVTNRVLGTTLVVKDLAATLLQRRNLVLRNVRIKDGETLIIGGMLKENESKSVNKIPLLGDLPGIGMFFRSTTSEKEVQELVIMLTPRIIKETEDLVNEGNTAL